MKALAARCHEFLFLFLFCDVYLNPFSQESADGFVGEIDRNEVSVNSGDQHTIHVRNMIMPNLPEDMKIRYSLKARKEMNKKRRKREENPNRK